MKILRLLPTAHANKTRTPRVFAWCKHLHGTHFLILFDPFWLAASAKESLLYIYFCRSLFPSFHFHLHMNFTLTKAPFFSHCRADRMAQLVKLTCVFRFLYFPLLTNWPTLLINKWKSGKPYFKINMHLDIFMTFRIHHPRELKKNSSLKMNTALVRY